MSTGTPEILESRYQRAQSLARQSWDRARLYMAFAGAGVVGIIVTAAYVSEKYYPLNNTLEEIQRGQISPATETALWASMGVVTFEVFSVASVLAAGYNAIRHVKYNRESNKLLKEMERQSKRPPTLGS